MNTISKVLPKKIENASTGENFIKKQGYVSQEDSLESIIEEFENLTYKKVEASDDGNF